MPERLKRLFLRAFESDKSINEIRLRKSLPIVFEELGNAYFLSPEGSLVSSPLNCVLCKEEELDYIFGRLCHYSVFSFKEDLNSCFITLPSGGRVGIACHAVCKSGEVSSVKDISSLNFRVQRKVKTEAAELLNKLYEFNLPSTVIIGAPCSGKTTLLREICRLLSSGYKGKYLKCAVIDERGEIAASNRGKPSFDVGYNTDVLSYFPKAQGILNALRTLSPEWIFVDEIGTKNEAQSVLQGLNSGTGFFLSAHAAGIDEALRKPQLEVLLSSKNIGAAVLLGSGGQTGKIKEIRRL